MFMPEEPRWHSQCGQDRYVAEVAFPGKRGGTFVEMGAYDGVTLSNTLALERDLGWTGLCVEPVPDVYARLRANRACDCVWGCAGANDGEVELLHLDGPSEMLSTIAAGVDDRHQRRMDHEAKTLGGAVRRVVVPRYGITELLLAHGLARVDFFSLDVEGAELEILAALDTRRVEVRTLSVENDYHGPRLAALLEPRGYKLTARLGQDEFYTKR